MYIYVYICIYIYINILFKISEMFELKASIFFLCLPPKCMVFSTPAILEILESGVALMLLRKLGRILWPDLFTYTSKM